MEIFFRESCKLRPKSSTLQKISLVQMFTYAFHEALLNSFSAFL